MPYTVQLATPNQSPYAEYVQHAWTGALVCSAFRNEGRLATADVDWDEIGPSSPAGSSGTTWRDKPGGKQQDRNPAPVKAIL
jgi:hypothetical protein